MTESDQHRIPDEVVSRAVDAAIMTLPTSEWAQVHDWQGAIRAALMAALPSHDYIAELLVPWMGYSTAMTKQEQADRAARDVLTFAWGDGSGVLSREPAEVPHAFADLVAGTLDRQAVVKLLDEELNAVSLATIQELADDILALQRRTP